MFLVTWPINNIARIKSEKINTKTLWQKKRQEHSFTAHFKMFRHGRLQVTLPAECSEFPSDIGEPCLWSRCEFL